MLRRKADNSIAPCVEERSGGDEKRTDALLHERGERCIQFRVIVRPTHEKLLIDRFGRRFDIRHCTDGGRCGFTSIPINGTPGTSSRSRPSRFDSVSLVQSVKPVTLPPGCLKLATMPALTGSPPIPKTTGIVLVAFVAATAETSPPTPTSTATPRPTKSAARAGNRS